VDLGDGRQQEEAAVMGARTRGVLVLAVLAALAFPAAIPSIADAHFGSVPAQSAKAKKKRCTKTQVRVRVGKRVVCRPFKKAFPKPKAGDPRQLFTKFVFAKDWSRVVRTRRGKRIPSLPKLIRKAGPRAPALLAKVTRLGLARLDAMEAAAVSARARAAQSSGGCAAYTNSGQRQRDTVTSSSGGTTATVGLELGPDGESMDIGVSRGEYTISVDVNLGLCDPNEVEAPDCPTAAGQLDGQIRYKLKASVKVTKGDTDIWSQAMDVTRRTKLSGFTAVDAKLDELQIEDVETSNLRLGGTTRAFPPISIRTQLRRRTAVDMRSGSYDPGRSEVNVRIDMEGLYGPDRDDAETDSERRAQADADSQFRTVVEKAMSGYRTREDRWQESPYPCARLEFQPGKNSLRLKPDQTGSFTATAFAKSDGQLSELDARLTSQVGASFSPTRNGGQRARFDYTVSHSTRDRIATTVRATSKAGVAEDTWEQPVEPPPPPPPMAYDGTYSGTAVYDDHELGANNHVDANWSGGFHAVWAGPSSPGASDARYEYQSGNLNYSFSGVLNKCDVSGSGVIDLGAEPDYQHVTVIYLVFDSPPRKYQLTLGAPLFATVPGTRSNCEDPNQDGAFDWSPGTGIPWLAYAPLPGGPVADNWNFSGSGSGNSGDGTPDQTWQWALTALP
jgi:hypothetical protein